MIFVKEKAKYFVTFVNNPVWLVFTMSAEGLVNQIKQCYSSNCVKTYLKKRIVDSVKIVSLVGQLKSASANRLSRRRDLRTILHAAPQRQGRETITPVSAVHIIPTPT